MSRFPYQLEQVGNKLKKSPCVAIKAVTSRALVVAVAIASVAELNRKETAILESVMEAEPSAANFFLRNSE